MSAPGCVPQRPPSPDLDEALLQRGDEPEKVAKACELAGAILHGSSSFGAMSGGDLLVAAMRWLEHQDEQVPPGYRVQRCTAPCLAPYLKS